MFTSKFRNTILRAARFPLEHMPFRSLVSNSVMQASDAVMKSAALHMANESAVKLTERLSRFNALLQPIRAPFDSFRNAIFKLVSPYDGLNTATDDYGHFPKPLESKNEEGRVADIDEHKGSPPSEVVSDTSKHDEPEEKVAE